MIVSEAAQTKPQPSPAHPGSEHLSKQEQAQASPETTREYRPSDFRWDISISIGDFGIELSENFNRWPGPTLLCLHSLVHGLSESKGFSPIAHWEKNELEKKKTRELRANSVRIARFSDSDSFSIHFFSRWAIGLNPFDLGSLCMRLAWQNPDEAGV